MLIPHKLRHSHASLLLHSKNINIKAISQRLGHSSCKVTLDTYAHYYEEDGIYEDVIFVEAYSIWDRWKKWDTIVFSTDEKKVEVDVFDKNNYSSGSYNVEKTQIKGKKIKEALEVITKGKNPVICFKNNKVSTQYIPSNITLEKMRFALDAQKKLEFLNNKLYFNTDNTTKKVVPKDDVNQVIKYANKYEINGVDNGTSNTKDVVLRLYWKINSDKRIDNFNLHLNISAGNSNVLGGKKFDFDFPLKNQMPKSQKEFTTRVKLAKNVNLKQLDEWKNTKFDIKAFCNKIVFEDGKELKL